MRPDPDAKLRPPVSCADTLHAGDTVRLDADAAAALRWRKINTREAFTLRDGAGTYFRAALQQLDADSAEALAYEQMDIAPESSLRIHLVCAVLQRQRIDAANAIRIHLGQLAQKIDRPNVVPDRLH